MNKFGQSNHQSETPNFNMGKSVTTTVRTEGFVVSVLIGIVRFIGKWSSVITMFYRPRDFCPDEQTIEKRLSQARRVDRLIVIWWIIPFVCLLIITWCPFYLRFIALIVLALRIVNIIFHNLRVALFEDPATHVSPMVSVKRSLVLGIVNYFELIICFGGVYAAFPRLVNSLRCSDWLTPFYLSCITQLTIGYGDVSPLAWLRPIACLQGISGLLLITITIGRFISLLRVEEIRKTNSNHCSECGQKIPRDAKYCTECGRRQGKEGT